MILVGALFNVRSRTKQHYDNLWLLTVRFVRTIVQCPRPRELRPRHLRPPSRFIAVVGMFARGSTAPAVHELFV